MTNSLAISFMSVRYGKLEAVRGANLSVRPGQVFSLIGANGAGKSTLLLATAGVLDYDGSVTFGGEEIDAMSVEDRALAGLMLVPERRELFADMTVEDNLRLGAFRRLGFQFSRGPSEFDQVFDIFPRLAERRRQRAGTLSGGERQMLALGRALMGRPRVLMLDEPSLGLAPLVVAEILSTIRKLADEGLAILLIEQNARAALRISNEAAVLDLGSITKSGNAVDLAQDKALIDSFLGKA